MSDVEEDTDAALLPCLWPSYGCMAAMAAMAMIFIVALYSAFLKSLTFVEPWFKIGIPPLSLLFWFLLFPPLPFTFVTFGSQHIARRETTTLVVASTAGKNNHYEPGDE